MRVGIIGSGALGSVFAAALSQITDVVMVGHWAEQLHAIRTHGLIWQRVDGRSTCCTFPVTHQPASAAPVDVAIMLVKSRQTARAAQDAAALLKRDGVLVTLQNGLGNWETCTAVLGPARVSLGVTTEGATMVRAGLVRHASAGETLLADQPPAQMAALQSLLTAAGLTAKLQPDVTGLQWGKLAINAAINPLTALLRVPNGFLAENEAARTLTRRAAAEVAAVAAAQSISLPFADAAQQAVAIAQGSTANHSSMLQDVQRGAPTEIDAICGVVVRVGRSLNVPTPVNRLLHHWIENGLPAALQTLPPAAQAVQLLALVTAVETNFAEKDPP